LSATRMAKPNARSTDVFSGTKVTLKSSTYVN